MTERFTEILICIAMKFMHSISNELNNEGTQVNKIFDIQNNKRFKIQIKRYILKKKCRLPKQHDMKSAIVNNNCYINSLPYTEHKT